VRLNTIRGFRCRFHPPYRDNKLSVEHRGASELALSGVWVSLAWCIGGRLAVAMPLFEAGVLELAVASLQQSSPTDWITWKSE